MEINQLFTLKSSDHLVSQNDCGSSRTVRNRATCSCKHLDCPNNGTKCIDNPDDPGIIQLPCLREKPSIDLCSTCCLFSYLNKICAFSRERA
jgi:hypothetical protein